MRQIQVADLTASANEIDNRMGPIPGRSSDRIAELRWAATDEQRQLLCRTNAGGNRHSWQADRCSERLQKPIHRLLWGYMAEMLQLKAACWKRLAIR
jgi:hypothetical protein